MELKKEDAKATLEFAKKYGFGKVCVDGSEGSVSAAILAIILATAVKGGDFSAYASGSRDLKIELTRDGKKQTIVFSGVLAGKEEA